MRVYPAVIEIMRTSKNDDVVPLSKPIIGVSGKIHTELRVPAGTPVFVSVIGYHLYAVPSICESQELRPVSHIAGIRMCGDRILMNSDRNDGST